MDIKQHLIWEEKEQRKVKKKRKETSNIRKICKLIQKEGEAEGWNFELKGAKNSIQQKHSKHIQ